MTRFAVICPPFQSHVSAIEALAGVLADRGHDIVWLHQQDAAALLRDARMRFVPLGHQRFPPGSLAPMLARAARPGGPFGLRRVIDDLAATTDMLCTEGAAALAALQVDVVIADQMEGAGALLAASLGLPWVSVACALPVNREPGLPLPVMPWTLAASEWAVRRNAESERVHDWLMQPLARVLRAHSRRFRIGERSTLADCVSPWLQLSQATAGFDFPRRHLPSGFHHVGPLRGAAPPARAWSSAAPAAPGARPFAFASLGTLQGGRLGLFSRIASACRAAGIELLAAHCGGLDARGEQALRRAGATQVVDFAPQREVLARADLLITHAGLNTVLDALAAGVPMLALPIAFDQPGVAARVAHAGAGIRLLPALASTRAMARALRRLLDEPSFRARAASLGAEVRSAPGATGAADLIEAALAAVPCAPAAPIAPEVAHAA